MSQPASADPPPDPTTSPRAAAASALAEVVGQERPAQRRGAALQAVAALLWVPQAVLIAITLAALVEGTALPL
ncbi:MAG: hypothetical protein KDA49_08660, partial [Rhodospirillaceae bacterium]|nr:hypothetical protein [Rhodospirillaceae bacterium]